MQKERKNNMVTYMYKELLWKQISKHTHPFVKLMLSYA
jgi:hypothetical protein